MSIEGKLVNELTTTTPAINDIALSTESASPTILKRSTWQAIYNLFKGIYDSASATLTNKTISGASNTLTNISQSSVTNLTSDLSGKANLTGGNTFSGNQDIDGQVYIKGGGTGPSPGNGLHVWFDTSTNEATISGFHAGVDWRKIKYNGKSHSFLTNDNERLSIANNGDLIVNGQNWTSAWTSFTPTLIGDTGSATIGTIQFCKIQPRGKQLEIVGRFSFTKNTMSGTVKMGVSGYTFSDSTIKACIADQGSSTLYNPLMLGQAGGSYITFEKQMATNLIVASDLGAGTIWIWFNGTLELA